MPQKEPTFQSRTELIEEDIHRLQVLCETFEHILSRRETESRLLDFDLNAEQEIGEIFGSPSEMLEAYEYAKLGEAGGWMNLPEEAQESGAQDIEELSFKQRSRVLERGIANLKTRRSILIDLNKA